MELTNDMTLEANTKDILERRINEFTEREFKGKNTDQYKDYKDLFEKTFDVENLDFFKLAVLLGYNDTKRTLSGIGKLWDEDNEKKCAFIKEIATGLQYIIKDAPSKFNDNHNNLCQDLRNNKIFEGTSVKFTYGHAQKIVNMAFKYLFCMEGSEKYKDIFMQCHMPLDSYTLEWYKRSEFYKKITEKKALLTSDDTWSKMTEEQYLKIREYIENNVKEEPFFVYDKEISLPPYPLYAEFIIWPEMQLHTAAEDFISSYSNDPKDDKKELKGKNLQYKLDRIKEIIEKYKPAFQGTKTE